MKTFHEMGLSPFVLHSLDKMKIVEPTPIQAETVPISIEGQDVLGSAQTGTGKTLAFAIPLVERLLKLQDDGALILAPTRELAQQVIKTIKDLTRNSPTMKTALLIGGEHIVKQFKQLRANPRIIVGTPGRVIDHLSRKTLDVSQIRFLVLDETDRMLDMGFGIQLEEIIPHLPKNRQTLMFSATFPKNIMKLAGQYLNEPKRISIGSTTSPAAKIKQETMRLTEGEKYPALLTQLEERDGSIIIFVKTKIGADKLADKLLAKQHEVAAIHGDLHQRKRERVIRSFRSGRIRVLVATDVAARGLDIPHIQHVINYDLPQCPEDYIHRIGRTARAGASGSALCFVTPGESGKWKAIDHYLQHGTEMPQPKRQNFNKKARFSRFKKEGSATKEKNGKVWGKRSSSSSSSPKRFTAKPGAKPGARPQRKQRERAH